MQNMYSTPFELLLWLPGGLLMQLFGEKLWGYLLVTHSSFHPFCKDHGMNTYFLVITHLTMESGTNLLFAVIHGANPTPIREMCTLWLADPTLYLP